MAFTKEELIKIINLDEPDYEEISKRLTKDDVPMLVELSKDANPAIATKAISCLGSMKTDAAITGLQVAVAHKDPIYRVAAAQALRNVPTNMLGVRLLDKLLDDPDIGVRKFALTSVKYGNISSLKERVKQINQREANESLRTLSSEILQKLK